MSDKNAPAAPGSPDSASSSVSSETKIRELLAQASPWLRFLVVLGYAVVAIGAVAAVGLAIFALVSGQAPQLLMTGVTFLLVLAIFYFPLRLLSQIAKGTRLYKNSGEATGLELVARGVKGLAKFYGILAIVMIPIYVAIGISRVFFNFGA